MNITILIINILCIITATERLQNLPSYRQNKNSHMAEIILGKAHWEFNLILGIGPDSNNMFLYPYSMAFDKNGYIYIADRGNKRIQIFDEKGEYVDSIGNNEKNRYPFNYLKAIAINPNNGKLYVGQMSRNQWWIIIFNDDYSFYKKIKIPYSAAQIGFDGDRLIVSTKINLSKANIYILDEDGHVLSMVDRIDEKALLASSRVNAAMGYYENIILADEFRARVRIFSLEGERINQFNYTIHTKKYVETDDVGRPLCYDVAFDTSGQIYLLMSTDADFNELCSLYQYDATGKLIDRVDLPFLCSRIFIDESDNIYFLSQMETGFLYRYRRIKSK